MRRAGYAGLKRNVAGALGNWEAEEAVAVLVEALSEDDPLVRGHAAWALRRIGVAPGSSVELALAVAGALSAWLSVEADSEVRDELALCSLGVRPDAVRG